MADVVILAGKGDDGAGPTQPVKVDGDTNILHVVNWVYNTSTLAWERMTQPVIDATGSTISLAVDDLEGLITSGNGILTTIDQAIDDQRMDYLYAGVLTSGTDEYVGYEDKDGNYYIVKYDTNGNPTYTAGTGGIPDQGTPTNWTGLSFSTVRGTF